MKGQPLYSTHYKRKGRSFGPQLLFFSLPVNPKLPSYTYFNLPHTYSLVSKSQWSQMPANRAVKLPLLIYCINTPTYVICSYLSPQKHEET